MEFREERKCITCGRVSSDLTKLTPPHYAHLVPRWIDKKMEYDGRYVYLCQKCHVILERFQLLTALNCILFMKGELTDDEFMAYVRRYINDEILCSSLLQYNSKK